MAHGGDVIAELMSDHREIEAMFDDIQSAPPGDAERKRLIDEVTIELVRHAVAEEQHLYPAVREHVPEGGTLADKELGDHARVERILKTLEDREADAADFNEPVLALINEVKAHVLDEEERLFVLLREACSSEALRELGEKVRQAKQSAPTRPHPGAPDTPPLNKLLDRGAGLVDRARDAITGRGRG